MKDLWDRLERRKEVMRLSMMPVHHMTDMCPFTLVPYVLPSPSLDGDESSEHP